MFESIRKTTSGKFDLASLLVLARGRRYFTAAIASIAIMVLLFVVFLIPSVQRVFALLGSIQEVEATYNDRLEEVSFLQSLDQSQLNDDIRILNGALPKTKPVLPLLATLERLAGQSSVSVANLQLTPGELATGSAQLVDAAAGITQFAGVSALPLTFEVQGTFENLTDFFRKLDLVVPLVYVKTIEFTTANQDQTASSSAEYRSNVELDSLYTVALDQPVDNIQVLPNEEDRAILTTLSQSLSEVSRDAQIGSPTSATGSGRFDVFSP